MSDPHLGGERGRAGDVKAEQGGFGDPQGHEPVHQLLPIAAHA